MTADQIVLLALRLAMAVVLYLFLSALVRAIWTDLRRAASAGPAPAAPTARAQIVLLDPTSSGVPAGEALPVTAETTVGRAEDNGLVLDDDFVSGHHAVIRRQNGAWWVADVGSTNGTWANDRRVERPLLIKPGDTLRFGRLRARFEA